MSKDDLLNIVAEIDSLKKNISYLKKKSEITPLIALYNHISGHNKEGKYIITSIEIQTVGGTVYEYSTGSIMLINDIIYQSTGKGLKKICSVEDVKKIKLDDFEYKFDD